MSYENASTLSYLGRFHCDEGFQVCVLYFSRPGIFEEDDKPRGDFAFSFPEAAGGGLACGFTEGVS